MKTEIIASFDTPFRTRVEILRQTFTSPLTKPAVRVAFVTGLHGDEWEGMYACHRLLEFLNHLKRHQPGSFLGEIHVYPAVNPPALNHGTRLWPGHSVDFNRTLGKNRAQSLPHQMSAKLFEDIQGAADVVVDLHASNLHLRELPQIRVVEEFAAKVLPLARFTNTDVVWIHPMAPVFRSTLGYNLNRAKIPTLVLEAGICLRVTPEYGDQVFAGMVNLLLATGALDPSVETPGRTKRPQEIRPNQVVLAVSTQPGLFIPEVHVGDFVGKGRSLGRVLDPVKGKVSEEVTAPGAGLLFTLRETPLVSAGALLARIALEFEPPP